MIKVKISNNNITISGHSMYDEKGKDIVCASVSTLVITTVNAIMSFDKDAISYKTEDGFMSIDILKETKEVKKLIDNMIYLLKDLEKQYSKYIKEV